MVDVELVDSGVHATVRMRQAGAGLGGLVRIVLAEFATAAAACPLLFSKHAETGAFYAGALLGFKESENLTLSPDGEAAFRPLEAAREGFFAVEDKIALDPAHPRFQSTGGDPLFDGQGQPTAPLKAVQQALGGLMGSAGATDQFIAALLAHRLIEPIDISLSFDDGERLRLEGLYTVSLDAIGELDDGAALALFRAGHLQFAYMMVASLQHIPLMARRRNAALAMSA